MIDFTSKDFKFIAKPDEYYVSGSEVTCEGDYTEWKDGKLVSDGWGLFRGPTMVSYNGYRGELPRIDGDTSNFGGFIIYYRNTRIDHLTLGELKSLILSENRNVKLNGIGI